MKLEYQTYGKGEPLVILHGLFGAGSNWQSVAKDLASMLFVVTPDLRNHGSSPWSEDAGYTAMTEDVDELLAELPYSRVNLAGHSLGGKVAMLYALRHPDRVKRLVVVDIAPKTYPPYHWKILEALRLVDTSSLTSRDEADAALAESIRDPKVRAFLLTNLVRSDGSYSWRINLEALSRSYEELSGWPDQGFSPYKNPALFVRGEMSDYIADSDRERILELFPETRIETIAGASHWVHAERRDSFLDAIKLFLLPVQ